MAHSREIDEWLCNWKPHHWYERKPPRCDLLPPLGSKILDIGCGAGALPALLYKICYDAYGVDLPGVIKGALQHFPEMAGRLIPCNLEFDSLPIGPWDMIYCLGVIEFLVNYEYLLHKIARVLKPKAIVYLITRNKDAQFGRCEFRHFSESEMAELAEGAGLDIMECNAPTTRLEVVLRG